MAERDGAPDGAQPSGQIHEANSLVDAVLCTAGVTVPLRANLLRSLLGAGVPYRWSCEQATCGKCQCQVQQGAELLSRPTVNEPARLSQTLVGMGFRLACQAKVIGTGEIKLLQR
jgi:ferredoxin